MQTQSTYNEHNCRRAYYLSLEYLMGRLFNNYIFNAGLEDEMQEALKELGVNLADLKVEEPEMGLGNEVWEACRMLSRLPGHPGASSGRIRDLYEFGLFQSFENGHQVERRTIGTSPTARLGRLSTRSIQEVPLYGHVEDCYDDLGHNTRVWKPSQVLIGLPHDLPILDTEHKPSISYDYGSPSHQRLQFGDLQQGGYVEAVKDKTLGESISQVFTPTTKPSPERNSDSSNNTSSSLAPSRTSSAVSKSITKTGSNSRIKQPSSSTTPTPPSPYWSLCAY